MKRFTMAVALSTLAACSAGRMERTKDGWTATVPVKLADDAKLADCSTRLHEEAKPPVGLRDATFAGNGSPALVTVMKAATLNVMALARAVPIAGGAVAQQLGREAKASEDGKALIAEALTDAPHLLEVVCPQGHGSIRLAPPDAPGKLSLERGANVSVTLPAEGGPWHLVLFKDESFPVKAPQGSTGETRLTNLPPGKWLIGALAQESAAAVEVELKSGENPPIALTALQVPKEPGNENAEADAQGAETEER